MSVAIAVTLVSVAPLRAQRTSFNPIISLDYLYVDNVQYLGDNGTPDSGYRLGIRLPLVRQFRRGTLNLTYSPKFERYQKFEQLNNTGHSLDLGLYVTPTPISKVTLTSSFSRTQDQGDPADPYGDAFVGRRTERDLAALGFSYRNRLSGRFLWGFNTQFTDTSYKNIEDFVPAGTDLIGRQTLRGSLDLLRSLSPTTSMGLRLGYGKFRLDDGTDGDSREVGLIVEHALGQRTDFSMGLGVYEREDATPQDPNTGIDNKRSGIQGFMDLRRQLRRASLSLNAKRATTDGGILAGTSTDTSLGFSVSGTAERRWSWSIATRYARREPTDEQRSTIDTLALGLNLGVKLHRRLQLSLSPVYLHQTGNDAGADALVLRGGFGLSWAPLEKTRLGRSGG
jgi:hypothetical protein